MIHGRIVKRTRNGFYVEKPKRLRIYFSHVQMMQFERTEQELLAYNMPITSIIESNTVKDISPTRFGG